MDDLFLQFRTPLPDLSAKVKGVNDLDFKIRETRVNELVCAAY